MNMYMDQPAAPPRRKRSLSTSRNDYPQDSGYGFQSNPIRRNYSTDHIPGGYAYGGMQPKPIGSSYVPMAQQQQPFTRQGPYAFNGGGMPAARHQPYSSYGNHLNQVGMFPGSGGGAGMGLQSVGGYGSQQGLVSSSQPIPRFTNPYAISAKGPVRGHQDYLKYVQPNIHYNPYQTQFSPTLMARPDIRPFQRPEAGPTFQKRDRSPYNSHEQLNAQSFPVQNSGNAPQRPPPPKTSVQSQPQQQGFSRLSVENLTVHAPTVREYEEQLSSNLRDRRSVSPTRFSHSPQPPQQRSYGSTRHSTSPLPGSYERTLSTDNLSSSLRRTGGIYGSKGSLNSPSGYTSPRIASSRESSPFTRPISPFDRRPASPYLSSYSSGLDSLVGVSRTRSYTSSIPNYTKTKFDRSLSNNVGLSSAASHYSTRFDRSISASNDQNKATIDDDASATTKTTKDAPTETSAAEPCKDTNTESSTTPVTTNDATDSSSLSLLDSQMDSLQVPNGGGGQQPEAFTDHCDQYKSVTAKILGRKNAGANHNSNRNSGDFDDVNTNDEFLQMSLDQQNVLNQLQQQQLYDTLEQQQQQEQQQRQLTPTELQQQQQQQLQNLEQEKKILENQLFNSPPISRLTSRNNSFAFDSMNSPSVSRKNSTQKDITAENFDQILKQHHTNNLSRRNSASSGIGSNQRKGSLPSDYLAHPDTFEISNDWSREKVATLAHEARQRAHNPPGNQTLKKIGVWCTKQFVFLIIAAVNILIAYAFYNLFAMLPADI